MRVAIVTESLLPQVDGVSNTVRHVVEELTDTGHEAVVVAPGQPDEMFALDRFHPSGAGCRRTAKAMLPGVLAALGQAETVPFGHHSPVQTGVSES